MILLLNTSTPTCQLYFADGNWRYSATWDAQRSLAKGLLGYLQRELAEQGKTFQDLSGIVVYRGPGSFTGLRIGITVCNTLSDGLGVPIVGETGDEWQQQGLARLATGASDGIVLPEYGSEAHITLPRK